MKILQGKSLTGLLLVFLLNVYASGLSAQGVIELLPLGDKDLAVSQPRNIESSVLLNRSRDDINLSWPLKPGSVLSETSPAYKASSKQYWLNASAKQLQNGIKLHTTAPGAIIKLSPRAAKTLSIAAADVVSLNQISIIDSRGNSHAAQSAMASSATAAQLENLTLPFSTGTIIFQLNEALGQGEFTLKVDKLINQAQPFTLYVLDKNSDISLSVQTENDTVFPGQSLRAQIALMQNKISHHMTDVAGYLLAPDGKKYSIKQLLSKKGAVNVSKVMDSRRGNDTGLWELHVIASSTIDGMVVRRHVKTSFAYSQPNAALGKAVQVTTQHTKGEETLSLTFAINAATSGRFELRGSLFATDSSGRKVPVLYANSAGWRAAGASTLSLTFDMSKLSDNTLVAPYEIRDLRLLDQSRMMLLHRQQKALRFP